MPSRIIIPASLMKVKTVDDLELWHMRRSQESPETVLEEIAAWNALMDERALLDKYSDPIDEYGSMELQESPESSSTEQATKSPPST